MFFSDSTFGISTLFDFLIDKLVVCCVKGIRNVAVILLTKKGSLHLDPVSRVGMSDIFTEDIDEDLCELSFGDTLGSTKLSWTGRRCHHRIPVHIVIMDDGCNTIIITLTLISCLSI